MFPRVGGAVLALAAAALLAIATLVPAWWSGYPDVDGHAMHMKTLDVGPLGASTCNTGGDGKCTNTSLTPVFRTIGRGEAGVNGVVGLLLVLLAIATLRRSEGRRPLGKIVIAAVAIAGLGGVLILVLGPGIKADGHTLTVPLSYGLALFWSGIATAIAAAMVTAREIPRALFIPPRPVANATPAPQAFDVAAMLASEEAQRAAAQHQEQQAAAQQLAQLAQQQAQSPPQFAAMRPQYETAPPVPPRPPMPERAPTPMPREQYERMQDGPAPGLAPKAPPPPSRPRAPSMPPPFGVLPPRGELPKPRPRAATLPPPKVLPAALAIPTPPPAAPVPLAPRVPMPAPGTPNPRVARARANAPTMQPPAEPPVRKSIPPRESFVLPMDTPAAPHERSETDPGDLYATHQRQRESLTEMRASLAAHEPTGAPGDEQPYEGETNAQLPAAPEAPEDDRAVAVADSTRDDVVPPPEPPEPPEPEPGDHTSPNIPLEPAADPTEDRPPALTTAPSPIVVAPPPPPDAPTAEDAEPKIPISTASTALPPPTAKQAATSGPTPACPQCESPMAWVEEHLRFYCKSCRMYF